MNWMLLVFLINLYTVLVLGRPQAADQPQIQHSQLQNASVTSPIPILNQSESIGTDGNFNFSYETGNKIHVQGGGYVKKIQLPQGKSAALNADGLQSTNGEDVVQVLTGEFSYIAPDGTVISLKYIADENGFQPEGAHLPTPPPIPPEIQRALSLLPKTDQQRSVEGEEEATNIHENREIPPDTPQESTTTNLDQSQIVNHAETERTQTDKSEIASYD